MQDSKLYWTSAVAGGTIALAGIVSPNSFLLRLGTTLFVAAVALSRTQQNTDTSNLVPVSQEIDERDLWQ